MNEEQAQALQNAVKDRRVAENNLCAVGSEENASEYLAARGRESMAIADTGVLDFPIPESGEHVLGAEFVEPTEDGPHVPDPVPEHDPLGEPREDLDPEQDAGSATGIRPEEPKFDVDPLVEPAVAVAAEGIPGPSPNLPGASPDDDRAIPAPAFPEPKGLGPEEPVGPLPAEPEDL